MMKLFNNSNFITVLGWIFGPLMTVIFTNLFKSWKNDKNRKHALDELSEKVERLIIEGTTSLDKNVLTGMCSFVSKKYNLKHKLLLSDVLDQVMYTIMGSIFVSHEVKQKVPEIIQSLKDQLLLSKNTTQKGHGYNRKLLKEIIIIYTIIFVLLLYIVVIYYLLNIEDIHTASDEYFIEQLVSALAAVSSILAVMLVLRSVLKKKRKK